MDKRQQEKPKKKTHEELSLIMREAALKHGFGKWMTGKKASQETKDKMSKSRKGLNTWAKGSKRTVEEKKKMSLRMSGANNYFFGKTRSQETKDKISKAKKGKKVHTEEWKRKISKLSMGNKNALGFKFSPEQIKQRLEKFHQTYDLKGRKSGISDLVRGTKRYHEWRWAIYRRDNYTCVLCKTKGGKLNADHIKPFSLYPELRFELSNGRTLCLPCHKATDTYGFKLKKNYGQR